MLPGQAAFSAVLVMTVPPAGLFSHDGGKVIYIHEKRAWRSVFRAAYLFSPPGTPGKPTEWGIVPPIRKSPLTRSVPALARSSAKTAAVMLFFIGMKTLLWLWRA